MTVNTGTGWSEAGPVSPKDVSKERQVKSKFGGETRLARASLAHGGDYTAVGTASRCESVIPRLSD